MTEQQQHPKRILISDLINHKWFLKNVTKLRTIGLKMTVKLGLRFGFLIMLDPRNY